MRSNNAKYVKKQLKKSKRGRKPKIEKLAQAPEYNNCENRLKEIKQEMIELKNEYERELQC
jgi:hypothetical protein